LDQNLGELIGTVLHSFFSIFDVEGSLLSCFSDMVGAFNSGKRVKRKAIQKHHSLGKIIPYSLPIISRVT